MFAVGAFPVFWGSYGSREGLAGPLGPVWPLYGAWPVPWALYARLGVVAGPLGPVWLPSQRGRSRNPLMAAMGA